MADRGEERTRHTRLGWWVMTHDRAGAALIGCAALAVLIADLIYVASRWHGLQGQLARGFAFGFGVLLVVGLIAKVIGLDKPIGPDRRKARIRARFSNLVALLVIGLLIVAPRWFGGSTTGVLLGEVAAVAAFFTAFTAWWVARD